MESLEQVDSWRKGEAETAERAGGRRQESLQECSLPLKTRGSWRGWMQRDEFDGETERTKN